jgi:hypothetical protein
MSPSASSLLASAAAVDPTAVGSATTSATSTAAKAGGVAGKIQALGVTASQAASQAGGQIAAAQAAAPTDFSSLVAQASTQGASTQGASAQGSAKAGAAVIAFNKLATKAGAASASASAAANTAATDAATASAATTTAPADPLAGLQAVLFSGPLQIPAATTLATSQGQEVQSALKAEAPTASAATLSGWSAELSALTQKLNQVEKAATGVDPSAPPAGWVEPANFQAARGLLTSLQATVAQAQAAQGVVGLAAQPTGSAASATAAALQAVGLRFAAPQPKGQATSRLFGSAGENPKTSSTASAQAGVSSGVSTTGAAGASVQTAVAQVSAQSQASTPASAPASPPAGQVEDAKVQTTADIAPVQPQNTESQGGDATATANSAPTVQAEAVALQDLQARSPAPLVDTAAATVPSASASGPSATARSTDSAAADAKTSAVAQTQAQTQAQAQADAVASGAVGADTSSAQSAPLSTAATTQGPTGAATQAPPAAVAYLASEIVKQASGKTTSFNIELHPADLGKVDVKLQIQADGQLAARMSFDNPAAAASFQANADSLRQSLQQAGFHVGGDALSFTSGGGQQAGAESGFNGQGSSQNGARAFAGAQVAASLAAAASADPLSDPFQARQAIGLDMRI